MGTVPVLQNGELRTSAAQYYCKRHYGTGHPEMLRRSILSCVFYNKYKQKATLQKKRHWRMYQVFLMTKLWHLGAYKWMIQPELQGSGYYKIGRTHLLGSYWNGMQGRGFWSHKFNPRALVRDSEVFVLQWVIKPRSSCVVSACDLSYNKKVFLMVMDNLEKQSWRRYSTRFKDFLRRHKN